MTEDKAGNHADQSTGNGSSDELLPLVYEELRHLAGIQMRRQSSNHTLQPTALVHEAWIRLNKNENQEWNDRTHFFRAAAQAMRCILVDKSRQKASLKRGPNVRKLSLEDTNIATVTPDDHILLVDEALTLLEREDPEGARIVILKFFGGFSNKEIAQTLNMSLRTVERQWTYSKTRIFEIIAKLPPN